MQVATLQRAMLENIYREMCNAANMTLTLPLTLTLALTLTLTPTLALTATLPLTGCNEPVWP